MPPLRGVVMATSRWVQATLTAVAFIGGCRCATSFEPWSYIYCKGNARQIADWARHQNDWKAVYDSLCALRTLVYESGDAESRNAADGYVAIYEKVVAGWPGLTCCPESGLRPADEREAEVRQCFAIVGSALAGREGEPRLAALYYRLRPPDSDAGRYSAWQMAAAGELLPRQKRALPASPPATPRPRTPTAQ